MDTGINGDVVFLGERLETENVRGGVHWHDQGERLG